MKDIVKLYIFSFKGQLQDMIFHDSHVGFA